MLQCLKGEGHLYALDVDPIEMKKTKERLEKQGYDSKILSIRHLNFAHVDQLLPESGAFDFVMADLGVSMQIVQSGTGIFLINLMDRWISG